MFKADIPSFFLLPGVMFCCVFTQGGVLLCFYSGWCSVVFLLRVMFCGVFTQGDVLGGLGCRGQDRTSQL